VVVLEVTDDNSLEKQVRKQRQVVHAPHISTEAKRVKLADKISNLRDILASPPADWTAQRMQTHIEWAAGGRAARRISLARIRLRRLVRTPS